MNEPGISRRSFLASSGALVVSFSLWPQLAAAQQAGKAPALPGSLKSTPMLDSWIRIDAKGDITVFTGKVELGQGVKTALIQVAAEELVVEPRRIKLARRHSRTPDAAIPRQSIEAGQRNGILMRQAGSGHSHGTGTNVSTFR